MAILGSNAAVCRSDIVRAACAAVRVRKRSTRSHAIPCPGSHCEPTWKLKLPSVVWVSTDSACHSTL
jgi:hypothetical protein